MIALVVEGLRWCEHAGWLLVLCDPRGARRLQVTLSLPDALALGHELAGRATDRTGLYGLVGALLRERPRPASVQLSLGDAQRARVELVVEADGARQGFATSTVDGVALAVRASLPLLADEALLAAFGVGGEVPHNDLREAAPGRSEVPTAFRLALEEPGQ